MRRLARFIYQRRDWPEFTWDSGYLTRPLAAVRFEQGLLIGRVQGADPEARQEATVEMLTQDVVNSSAIEREWLDVGQVRSEIARRLGLDPIRPKPPDRHVQGMVEMTLDASLGCDLPLTPQRLFNWHACLFPTGRSGLRRIKVGEWRDDLLGPMQIVSGPEGRERVHFEAPAAERVPEEMRALLNWFHSDWERDWVLKAGVAHLWFVLVHPFDDGNGRMARAITDLALARSTGVASERPYSMSAQIFEEQSAYYEVLEKAGRGPMNVTPWLEWFLGCLSRAIGAAQVTLHEVLTRARLRDQLSWSRLNDRQRRVLNRLLEGFEGKLTTGKWAKLAKCSNDTALRDIQALLKDGVLRPCEGAGRATSYRIVTPGE